MYAELMHVCMPGRASGTPRIAERSWKAPPTVRQVGSEEPFFDLMVQLATSVSTNVSRFIYHNLSTNASRFIYHNLVSGDMVARRAGTASQSKNGYV